MSDENNGHNGCIRATATKPLPGFAPFAGSPMSKPVVPAAAVAESRRQGGKATERFSLLQVPLLAAVINHLHRNLKDGQEAMQKMENNEMFKLFCEDQYQRNKTDLPQSFKETVSDRSMCHVSSFILSVLHQGRFSVTECIICLFYLSRFKQSSKITLHAAVWRPLFLTALLISDKVWQDMPVRNSALTKLFPVLSNSELKKLEYEFVTSIKFEVNVSPESFKQFCETLLAEKVEKEIQDRVYSSEFVLALTRPEGQLQNPAPEGLHEDHLWANEEEADTAPPKSLKVAPVVQPQPALATSPRAASLNPARGQAHVPNQRPLNLRGPLTASRDGAVHRQSHSLGSLAGAMTGTPSASGRMSAAMRATPLSPALQKQNQPPYRSPTTPEGARSRQMGMTLAPGGSASAGCMVRAASGGHAPAVPSVAGMSSGYPGLRSPCSNREANSPRAKSAVASAATRSAASPNREASSRIAPAGSPLPAAGSPLREAMSEATTGVPSSSGGSNPSSTPMLSCSSSAPSAAKRGESVANGHDPHSMSFKQKQQLFAAAKARPGESVGPRQTLRDRAAATSNYQGLGGRANSLPADRASAVGMLNSKQPSKTLAQLQAARVAAPGVRGAVAANKFSPQGQEPQQSTRSQSSVAAVGTSPGHHMQGSPYSGMSGMTPRAGLQAQRSRATVGSAPTVRPAAQQQQQQQQVTAPQSPGQPGSPLQGATSAVAYGQPWNLNTARGRSSSPSYIVAENHTNSLPTTARLPAKHTAR